MVASTSAATVAHPKIGDEVLLSRLSGHIKGRPQDRQMHQHQDEAQDLVLHTNCGLDFWQIYSPFEFWRLGSVSRDPHYCYHWSRFQAANFALSIGEAELGSQNLWFGGDAEFEEHSELDSSANTFMTLRHRVDQLNHLTTRTMWVQPIFNANPSRYDGSRVS